MALPLFFILLQNMADDGGYSLGYIEISVCGVGAVVPENSLEPGLVLNYSRTSEHDAQVFFILVVQNL